MEEKGFGTYWASGIGLVTSGNTMLETSSNSKPVGT